MTGKIAAMLACCGAVWALKHLRTRALPSWRWRGPRRAPGAGHAPPAAPPDAAASPAATRTCKSTSPPPPGGCAGPAGRAPQCARPARNWPPAGSPRPAPARRTSRPASRTARPSFGRRRRSRSNRLWSGARRGGVEVPRSRRGLWAWSRGHVDNQVCPEPLAALAIARGGRVDVSEARARAVRYVDGGLEPGRGDGAHERGASLPVAP